MATLSETATDVAIRTASLWTPLLNGELKRRAEDTVRDIANAVRSLSGTMPAGLAGGGAGLAVLEAYLSRAGFDGEEGAAERWLERAVEAMSKTEVTASLYSGLTGIGWAVELLRPELQRLDPDVINDEIDETLLDLLQRSGWDDEYDLVGGLVGYGVYALERLPRPTAAACLEQIVDRLTETARHQPDGATWWTDPSWLPPETRAQHPCCGYFNLGLAHGVPGVIGLLGRICAAGIAIDKARTLLDEAVRWLLAQQSSDGSGFGHWVEPDARQQSNAARLAWCYGDPGIAAALLVAARCIGEPTWEREALEIARRAARRSFETSGVKDAGLCHGAAGLGHIINRMYHATGDQELCAAARDWFEQTLAMRRADRGIAGYQAWWGGAAGGPEWYDDPGILTGAAGVALALAAACSDIEPNWDRMLLISILPKQQDSEIRDQRMVISRTADN